MKNKLKPLPVNSYAFFTHGVDQKHKDFISATNFYMRTLRDKPDAKGKMRVPVRKGYRFTVCALVDSSTGFGYISVAICSPLDNFCKRNGRLFSLDKAVVYRNRSNQIQSGEPLEAISVDLKDNNVKDIEHRVTDHLIAWRDKIAENPTLYFKKNYKFNENDLPKSI